MLYSEISLIAFVTDKLFGEFRFIKHPVVLMGSFISAFEKRLYKDSTTRGGVLAAALLTAVYSAVFIVELLLLQLPSYLQVIFGGIIASTGIAGNMLYSSVKDILNAEDRNRELSKIVSRDTKDLTDSEINKAAIESYGENMSDGVVGPLFYLLFFGLQGLFLYKAVNTLDSMVGYRTKRYENYGKVSARLDDILNFIPARLTALLISLLSFSKHSFTTFLKHGKLHDSINAGYPIAAMAGALGIKLGGDTRYFGELKKKPCFGEGRESITKSDVLESLKFQKRFEIFTILFLGGLIVLSHMV